MFLPSLQRDQVRSHCYCIKSILHLFFCNNHQNLNLIIIQYCVLTHSTMSFIEMQRIGDWKSKKRQHCFPWREQQCNSYCSNLISALHLSHHCPHSLSDQQGVVTLRCTVQTFFWRTCWGGEAYVTDSLQVLQVEIHCGVHNQNPLPPDCSQPLLNDRHLELGHFCLM